MGAPPSLESMREAFAALTNDDMPQHVDVHERKENGACTSSGSQLRIEDAQAASATTAVEPETSVVAVNDTFQSWLYSLDGGGGTMLQYLEPMKREFESLDELAAG